MDAAEVFRTLEENHRNSAKHLGAKEKALVESACRYLASVDYEGTLVATSSTSSRTAARASRSRPWRW